MSMLQSFFKDSIFYLIPSILSRGIGFFLLPVYTRVLSPADYGAFDLFMVAASLINLTIALEVSQGLARHYPDAKRLGEGALYASTGLWFTLLTYSVALLLAFPFAATLSTAIVGTDLYVDEFKLALIYFLFNGLFLYSQSQLRWDLRSKQFAISSIIVTVVTAILALALSAGLSMGLSGILLALIISNALGALYSFATLKGIFSFTFSIPKLKEMLIFSLPLVPSSILVFLNHYIDRVMINHYLGLEETGIYGVGFRIASIMAIIGAAIQGAITPLIFNHYKESETPRQIATIFQVFTAVSLLMLMGLALFIKEFLTLMTTEAYYASSTVILILAPSILLSAMYVFAPGISIAKKTHMIVWINLAAAIINIGLNFILIPQIGLNGAAIATFASNLLAFAIYMHFSQRYYRVEHNWYKIAGVITIFGIIIIKSNVLFSADITLMQIFAKILILGVSMWILYATKIIDVAYIKNVYLTAKQK
jgi:O-antigen/teichoic acid export membrane protein